ncbi:hypothetical protein [Tropicimonas sediminicola]|uniref:Lipoprotein-attachment site-containing protein n=1 Tax=Tropicimonas sediminicola TaxID=1031541 RepID=A0A239FDE0_9RHOB|nr:hypothetical protein [Tropicimonas sediminicola]SNS54936.1 hypothetical protein SAMN05421757_102623 [Tropicimonas sediminicola]
MRILLATLAVLFLANCAPTGTYAVSEPGNPVEPDYSRAAAESVGGVNSGEFRGPGV